MIAASEDDPSQLYTAPSDGGAAKLAAKELDLIPGALQWDHDGKSVYFETGARGEKHFIRVDLASGAVRPVTSGPAAVRSVNVGASAMRKPCHPTASRSRRV